MAQYARFHFESDQEFMSQTHRFGPYINIQTPAELLSEYRLGGAKMGAYKHVLLSLDTMYCMRNRVGIEDCRTDEERMLYEPLDSERIAEELGTRALNALRHAGIRTVGELKCFTERDLLRIRNMGITCIASVRWLLSLPMLNPHGGDYMFPSNTADPTFPFLWCERPDGRLMPRDYHGEVILPIESISWWAYSRDELAAEMAKLIADMLVQRSASEDGKTAEYIFPRQELGWRVKRLSEKFLLTKEEKPAAPEELEHQDDEPANPSLPPEGEAPGWNSLE